MLTGCQAFREMFTARPEVAAEAKGQVLRVERLAQLMTSIKGVPLTREATGFIANMWVDYTLFAQAVAAGRNLADSATAAQALWPDLAEARGEHWHDTLIAHRDALKPQVADSLYKADSLRIIQHILVRLAPNAEPPVRDAARRKADRLYAQLKAGANFAELAKKESDDPGTKLEGGYLPPAPRGKWVTAFDSAAWTLAPGAMSPVIQSPFGFHIIRRPPVDEVRDRLLAFVRRQIGVKIDSVYLDSLATRHHLQIAGGAVSAMRKALADRDQAHQSTEAIVTYDGGNVTVAYFMRWVSALGPTFGPQLAGSPDSSLRRFARIVGQNKILLEQADSAGIRVSKDEWTALQQRYAAQVDSLRESLGISGSEISDPAASAADRAKVAGLKLETFWDGLAASRSRPRPIPDQLATVLREEGGFSINQAGLDRALELARALKAKADSAEAAPKRMPAETPTPGAAPTAPSTVAPGGK